MRKVLKIFEYIGMIVVIFYILLYGILYLYQDDIIFNRVISNIHLSETIYKENFKILRIETSDGHDIQGWISSYADKKNIILYFHGNNGNLSMIMPVANEVNSRGIGFLSAEYRGYNNLEGTPSENNLYIDGCSYVDELIKLGIDKENIIIMGHSLGASVALEVAIRKNINKIILISPFTSVEEIASLHFPFSYFPKVGLRNKFDNKEKILKFNGNVLFIHGEKDNIVPREMSIVLYNIYKNKKKLKIIENAEHNDIFTKKTVECIIKWIKGE